MDILTLQCECSSTLNRAEGEVGEAGSVDGLLEAKERMYREISLRCTSGDAEYQCGCITPSVSRPA